MLRRHYDLVIFMFFLSFIGIQYFLNTGDETHARVMGYARDWTKAHGVYVERLVCTQKGTCVVTTDEETFRLRCDWKWSPTKGGCKRED